MPHREPIERPDLRGSVDMIGFSYYAAMGVHDGRLAIHPPDASISPLGYGIWADGVGLVLDRLHAELPGAPLPVAEYGPSSMKRSSAALTSEATSTGRQSTTTNGFMDMTFPLGSWTAIAMCDRVPESFSKRRNHAEPAPLPDYAAIPLMSPVWPAPSRQIPTSTALR